MERLEGAVSAARAADIEPVRLALDVLASPVGDVQIVCANGRVCAIDFGEFDGRMHAFFRRRFAAYEIVRESDPLGATTRLERYFAGDVVELAGIDVDGGGTPYQARVWAALRTIPPGRTRTYAQIAALVGATHPRAVGHANSLNPIAIVVPCHRVIGADASLTGYAGGLARKRWLLDHEARHAGPAPLFAFR